MIRWFSLSVSQLKDRAILLVLAKSLLLTLALFALGGVALFGLADWAAGRYQLGESSGSLIRAMAVLAGFAAAWLLFRAVAIPVIGLFADAVVAAVERRHYPQALASARAVSMPTTLRLGAGSITRLIGLNLLALPFYLLLIPTAIGPAALFVGVNALLLGRDLGDMVAARHLDRAGRKAWLRSTRGPRVLLGLIVSLLFMVPLANLFAPIIGAAMATHLFHGRKEPA